MHTASAKALQKSQPVDQCKKIQIYCILYTYIDICWAFYMGSWTPPWPDRHKLFLFPFMHVSFRVEHAGKRKRLAWGDWSSSKVMSPQIVKMHRNSCVRTTFGAHWYREIRHLPTDFPSPKVTHQALKPSSPIRLRCTWSSLIAWFRRRASAKASMECGKPNRPINHKMSGVRQTGIWMSKGGCVSQKLPGCKLVQEGVKQHLPQMCGSMNQPSLRRREGSTFLCSSEVCLNSVHCSNCRSSDWPNVHLCQSHASICLTQLN